MGLWDLPVWESSNQDCPVFMQSWKCSEETARNLDGSVASELRFFSHNMIATVIYCCVLIVFMRFVDIRSDSVPYQHFNVKMSYNFGRGQRE